MEKRPVRLRTSDLHQLEFFAATRQAHPGNLRRYVSIGDTRAGHSIEQRNNYMVLVGPTRYAAMHWSLSQMRCGAFNNFSRHDTKINRQPHARFGLTGLCCRNASVTEAANQCGMSESAVISQSNPYAATQIWRDSTATSALSRIGLVITIALRR